MDLRTNVSDCELYKHSHKALTTRVEKLGNLDFSLSYKLLTFIRSLNNSKLLSLEFPSLTKESYTLAKLLTSVSRSAGIGDDGII